MKKIAYAYNLCIKMQQTRKSGVVPVFESGPVSFKLFIQYNFLGAKLGRFQRIAMKRGIFSSKNACA